MAKCRITLGAALRVIVGYKAYRFYPTNQTTAIGQYLLVHVPQSGPAASRAPLWKKEIEWRKERGER